MDLFILSLPMLIYMIIINLTVRYKSIDHSKTFTYLCFGVMSFAFFKMIHSFDNLLVLPYEFLYKIMNPYTYKYIVCVGLVEELSKYLAFAFTFYLVYRGDKSYKNNIIVYCEYSYLTFALIENIIYSSNYSIDVIYTRILTANFLHFICGMITGYFVLLGYTKKKDMSFISILCNKYKTLSVILYTTTGILLSTILHGMYDLILMTSNSYMTYYLIILTFIPLMIFFKNIIKK